MLDYENISDLIFDNLKKILYPKEWISLDLEFSKSELLIMLLADKHPEITMGKAADYINVSMSTANGIVERLVKTGYLVRNRSDSDRRIVVISLTEKGRTLVNELKTTILNYVNLLNESLCDDERRLLFKVFNKITAILEKKSDELKTTVEKTPQVKKIEIE